MTRAEKKRERKRFKPGDVVTWGERVVSHRVLEVRADGLIVDASSQGPRFARYFVAFDGNARRADNIGRGPIEHSSEPPDVVRRDRA